jgi:hypothetical protein
VSLLVWLRDARTSSAAPGETFQGPVGKQIEIVLHPTPGLSIVGTREGTVVLAEPQPDLPLRFQVRADLLGPGSVRIYAFCGGLTVAAITAAIEVVADVPANLAHQAAEAAVVLLPRQPPDLSFFIFDRGNTLEFLLNSADGRFSKQWFGPTPIEESSARDYFRSFFRDIERLETNTPEERAKAAMLLEINGANLFEKVLPEDLRKVLWENYQGIRTLQITSSEPWIPWEVCRLTGMRDGRFAEGPFFAEAFAVTRWLFGAPPAPQLHVTNLALVVPRGSGLSHAEDERSFVRSMESPGRKVIEVEPALTSVVGAMKTGTYDAWHFTGHARADQGDDADRSAIDLDQHDSLTPGHLAGGARNMLLPRPFVFFNACQSAQAGISLTGVGGWAERLLQASSGQPGAAAFVGAYWAVDDAVACAFAQALYGGLLAGQAIGEAVRQARAQVRATGDPTWLAYTVYADPNACVVAPEANG